MQGRLQGARSQQDVQLKGAAMISEKSRNNINFMRIVFILRNLRVSGMITTDEYKRAKGYYQKVTGADIAVID